MVDIIDRIGEFLYKHLLEVGHDYNEIKYRYEHSLRVSNIGLELAKLENANKKVTIIACLLHDVGKFDTNDNIDHGRVSARIARNFLLKLDLSQAEIDDICYAIAAHVDRKCGYEYKETLEAKIVRDSDTIDRFGVCRINQRLIWDQMEAKQADKGKIIESKINDIEEFLKKLNRYDNEYNLETNSGNKKIKERLKLQMCFYDKYLLELKMTKNPIL